MNDYNEPETEQPQDPNSFRDFAGAYNEAREAKAEADESGIKPNRVKARAALEGMNAGESIRSKREALLALLDNQVPPADPVSLAHPDLMETPDPPKVKSFLGIRIENRRAIEQYHRTREHILIQNAVAVEWWHRAMAASAKTHQRHVQDVQAARERIFWAIIGELSLELSKVNCDRQAVEINADFLTQMRVMQGRYTEFRAFFLNHFSDRIAAHETTNRDLFSLAMEIMLWLKGSWFLGDGDAFMLALFSTLRTP